MNIVIIEDEVLTAEDLTYIINELGKDIRVLAVLGSVKEAIDFFRKEPAADLIFCDIQLGDGVSFEIFKTVKVEAPVIFCTAYDEYALEAIRSNGIDYILKPFNPESIAKAIDRFHRLKKHFIPADIDYNQLLRSVAGLVPAKTGVRSILVYHRQKVLPVELDKVALFNVNGELTYVHCFDNKYYTINQSLDELEKLAGTGFFRINRQYLVNRNAVTDADNYEQRKYAVNLSIPFKEVLVVSKSRVTEFLNWLTM